MFHNKGTITQQEGPLQKRPYQGSKNTQKPTILNRQQYLNKFDNPEIPFCGEFLSIIIIKHDKDPSNTLSSNKKMFYSLYLAFHSVTYFSRCLFFFIAASAAPWIMQHTANIDFTASLHKNGFRRKYLAGLM
jgi:hypothetical protein